MLIVSLGNEPIDLLQGSSDLVFHASSSGNPHEKLNLNAHALDAESP